MADGSTRGGNDRLEGGAGIDDLWGGRGNDMFVFGPGSGADTIHDFGRTKGDRDHIDIHAYGLKFSDLEIDQSSGDTVPAKGRICTGRVRAAQRKSASSGGAPKVLDPCGGRPTKGLCSKIHWAQRTPHA